jgi:hypothetical protein
MADYQSLINQKTQDVQSLSDRLAELEKMNSGFTKSGLDYMSSQKRPEGMSVIDFYTPRMNVGRLSGIAKENARANLDNGWKALNDLFGLKQNEDQFNKQYALDTAKSGLTADSSGNIIPLNPNDPENLTDSEATAKVKSIFGPNINLGQTMKDRGARAKAILKDYAEGKMPPLNDLLSVKESAARDAAAQLMSAAGEIYSAVTDQAGSTKNAAGVGTFQGRLPQLFTGPSGVTIRAKVTAITAAKLKELSGVAVSDKEAQRLQQYLPLITDKEETIAAKSKNVMDTLTIGMAMQEKAKTENLTLDQAYEKYAAPMYEQLGLEVPAYLRKISVAPGGTTSKNNNDPLGLGL